MLDTGTNIKETYAILKILSTLAGLTRYGPGIALSICRIAIFGAGVFHSDKPRNE